MIALLLLLLAPVVTAAAQDPVTQPPIFPLAERWSADLGAAVVANAPPVSDDGRVYVALRSGHVVAHALTDGTEVWRRAIATDRAIVADNDLVFVAGRRAIHALRGDTGVSAWERPSPPPTAPLLVRSGWLIVAAADSVTAIRAADGSVVWQQAYGPVTTRPAIDGDRLYLSLTDGRLIAIDLQTGRSIWQRKLEAAPGEPLAAGDRVYAGAADRRFYCLKVTDGDVDWVWRVGALVVGAPVIDGSNVVFVALDNVVRALDRSSGVQQWQHAIRRRAAAAPVVIRGAVLVASSTTAEIHAWLSDGKPAGTIATPAQPAVAPDVADGDGGIRLSVVTGSLAGVWRLTLIGPAPDVALAALAALPGTPTWTALEPPLLPLTSLPGRSLEVK